MKPRAILFFSSCCLAAAFSTEKPLRSRGNSRRFRRLDALDDNKANDPMSDLTGGLARLDQQWKIRQRSKAKSRWTQIDLKDKIDEPLQDEDSSTPFSVPQSITTDNKVYLLEPPNLSVPSCLIVFVGGAGLGQYPQIAYNELLLRISDKLNAAIIAAPYQVGLDHFKLSKRVGELARKAVIHCEDDPKLMYPVNMPTYCLGHSLGCKLLSIYLAATDQEFDGVGFMSFNNFAFSQTLTMAKQFSEVIAGGSGSADYFTSFMKNEATQSMFNQVLEFASTAVSAIGLDFTPTPEETERLISLKFDANRQQRTRLFVFDDDNLDNTKNFVNACNNGPGPSVSGLPGTHLTPVYFKFGIDDLPEETRNLARNAAGGLESASFGNEQELVALVEEIVGWVKGSQPSRKPQWDIERPQLAEFADKD